MEAILNDARVKFRLMTKDKTLGELIAELRHKEGMSQNELARRLDMSPTYISYVERGINPSSKSGKSQPSREFLESVAAVFRVPSDELLSVAGFASLKNRERSTDTDKIVSYFESLPVDNQRDALAILETLYSLHSATSKEDSSAPKPSGMALPHYTLPIRNEETRENRKINKKGRS